FKAFLDSEIGLQLAHIRFEIGVRDHIDHATLLDNIMTIRDRRSEVEILLDQYDVKAFLLELANGSPDLLYDNSRQPFGRLIQQEGVGTCSQNSRNRQHLLLAARKLRALAGASFFDVWKQLVDPRDVETTWLYYRGEHQVFFHRQTGEDAALLGAIANT